jgi:hypothetical protein
MAPKYDISMKPGRLTLGGSTVRDAHPGGALLPKAGYCPRWSAAFARPGQITMTS